MCCGLKLTNSLGRIKQTNSLGNSNITLNSHVIKSGTLKPRLIYEPAGVKRTIFSQFFFSSFELGGITKHLKGLGHAILGNFV